MRNLTDFDVEAWSKPLVNNISLDLGNKSNKISEQTILVPDKSKEDNFEEDTGNKMIVLKEFKNINDSTKIRDK